jgi:hypothetical protein
MKYAIGLFIGLLIGCASVISNPLRFQDRELLVHPDKPGLGYPHRATVCVPRTGLGRILGKKCHEEKRDDFYDMNDPAVRKSLIDGGFTCTSKMRFKY